MRDFGQLQTSIAILRPGDIRHQKLKLLRWIKNQVNFNPPTAEFTRLMFTISFNFQNFQPQIWFKFLNQFLKVFCYCIVIGNELCDKISQNPGFTTTVCRYFRVGVFHFKSPCI